MSEENTKYQTEWSYHEDQKAKGCLIGIVVLPIFAGMIIASRMSEAAADIVSKISLFVFLAIALILFFVNGPDRRWPCPRCGFAFHRHHGIPAWISRSYCRMCKLPIYYGSAKFYGYWGTQKGRELAEEIRKETISKL